MFAFTKDDPIRFKPTLFGNWSIRINNWPVGKIYKPKRSDPDKYWNLVIAGQIPRSYQSFEETVANAYLFAVNLSIEKGVEFSQLEQGEILDKMETARKYLEDLILSGKATR